MKKDDPFKDPLQSIDDSLLARLAEWGRIFTGKNPLPPKMYELFPRRERNPRRLKSGLIVTSKRTEEERMAQKKRKYLRKFQVQQATKKRHGRNIVTGKRSRVKR